MSPSQRPCLHTRQPTHHASFTRTLTFRRTTPGVNLLVYPIFPQRTDWGLVYGCRYGEGGTEIRGRQCAQEEANGKGRAAHGGVH